MGLLRVYLEYGVNIKTNTVHIKRGPFMGRPASSPGKKA